MCSGSSFVLGRFKSPSRNEAHWVTLASKAAKSLALAEDFPIGSSSPLLLLGRVVVGRNVVLQHHNVIDSTNSEVTSSR